MARLGMSPCQLKQVRLIVALSRGHVDDPILLNKGLQHESPDEEEVGTSTDALVSPVSGSNTSSISGPEFLAIPFEWVLPFYWCFGGS
jgi:hypothetical protein